MINRLEFSINIKAKKTTIWKALWDENNYRNWAGTFAEGSHYVTDDWNQGSKVMFLGPDGNGIFSSIETHIPNKFIQFKHLGSVVKGKEQPLTDETRKWSGATENYSLYEGTDSITLVIQIDVLKEHLEFMTAKLPKALKRIKDNCREQ
ncbi:hypothetical protein [uncultured Maribacter sp.]|uniref:hypothetical protein n=1 Tax=uncultured Maribacter sp. TaxID=431308 RepID=UPI00262EBF38|nr:hypothetical protein [uncultured Maribacter sp.]